MPPLPSPGTPTFLSFKEPVFKLTCPCLGLLQRLLSWPFLSSLSLQDDPFSRASRKTSESCPKVSRAPHSISGANNSQPIVRALPQWATVYLHHALVRASQPLCSQRITSLERGLESDTLQDLLLPSLEQLGLFTQVSCISPHTHTLQETETHTYTKSERHSDTYTEMRTHTETETQTHMETDTHAETERHIYTGTETGQEVRTQWNDK